MNGERVRDLMPPFVHVADIQRLIASHELPGFEPDVLEVVLRHRLVR
jgi:hypothetical protein